MPTPLLPWLTRRHIVMAGLAYILLITVLQLVMDRFVGVQIFGSFWASGHAATLGINPYFNYPLVFSPDKALGVYETNLNLPGTLPLFQLFALVTPMVGAMVWVVISAALQIACIMVLDRHMALSRLQLIWLFLTPLLTTNLFIGQIYAILFVLAVGLWFALRQGRGDLAGVLLGLLVAIKPNFAMCGLALFAAGHRRTAIIAGVLCLALSLLPILVHGPVIYAQWLAAVAADHHGALFANDISFNGYLHRAGLGGLAAPVVAVTVATGLYLALRSKGVSVERVASFGLWLGIACSPLAWGSYLLAVFPAMIALAHRRAMKLAMALTVVPAGLSDYALGSQGFTVLMGTVYLLPSLIIGWELYKSLTPPVPRPETLQPPQVSHPW